MPEVASDASSVNSQKRAVYKTDLGNLDKQAMLQDGQVRDLHVLLQCHKVLNQKEAKADQKKQLNVGNSDFLAEEVSVVSHFRAGSEMLEKEAASR
jgi:hypothetical protein